MELIFLNKTSTVGITSSINKIKKAAAIMAALTIFTLAGCRDNSASKIEVPASLPNPVAKPPPPDGLRLRSLNIYYTDDTSQKNLITPALNTATGDYVVTDAEAARGAMIVEAVPETENAAVKISWKLGARSETMAKSVTGAAKLEGIAIPDANTSERRNTLVSVKVSNGGKSYDYLIEIKAPGTDSSLKTLSIKYIEDAENDTVLGILDGGDKYFNGSRYDYTVEIQDAGKAGTDIVIAALPAAKGSEVELVNGKDIGAEAYSGGAPKLGGAEEPVAKYWKLKIPAAGSEALTAKLTVTNVNISSNYSVTIVPPPGNVSVDSSLMNLDFVCVEDGHELLRDFKSSTSDYTYKIQGGQKTVKILSCAPSYKNASVNVSVGSNEAFGYGDNTLSKQVITLPVNGGADLLVKFKVQAENPMYTQEYTVRFTNPKSTLKWAGSISITNNTSPAYKITGMSAVTAAGKSYDTNSIGANGEWSVSIDENEASAANPPASFIVMMERQENGKTIPYRSVAAATGTLAPNAPITLNVAVGSGAAAPNRVVYSPNDLYELSKNPSGNFYLANDIDLSELKSDWDGPNGYKGHFNGNGHTIKLALSKERGNTGLFNNLAGGAVIENLNVDVSTKPGLKITGDNLFGGVVGRIDGNQGRNYTLRNISVNAVLNYDSGSYAGNGIWLNAGALIGEINNSADVAIENCYTNIKIEMTNFSGNSKGSSAVSLGGLIGKIGMDSDYNGKVAIRNCWTSGSIAARRSDDQDFLAGGIIGCDGITYNHAKLGNQTQEELIIENSYSAVDIQITHSNNSAGKLTVAGGLVGYYNNTNSKSIISNSAALNPRVLAVSPNNAFSGRVIGYKGGAARLSNNYALSDMRTGTAVDGAAVAGGGDANSGTGLSKTATELSNPALWTGLGFAADKWDFSNLDVSAKRYPKFK